MADTALHWTADDLMSGIARAVKARYFPAVEALLKMLAVEDPLLAAETYGAMMAVLEAGRR